MTVIGTARLLRKFNAMPAAAQRRISDSLEASAAQLHSLAVQRIQKSSGTGRVYVRRSVSHVASAPGQYPNTDTGALVASMGWRSSSALSSEFYAGIVYAKYLEFGTSRMAPRPFMRPTFRELAPSIRKRVRTAVSEGLRSAYGR